MTVVSNDSPPVALRRATATMAVGTLLSRITGVGRIIALGYALGTGLGRGSPADAYNLAEHHPEHRPGSRSRRDPVGDLHSGIRGPPCHPRRRRRLGGDLGGRVGHARRARLWHPCVFLAASPFIVDGLTVLRHSPGERTVATYLLILFVPQLACYTFAALGAALLNARGRFGAPTFAPIANNVMTIVSPPRVLGRRSAPDARGTRVQPRLARSCSVSERRPASHVQALLLVPSLRRAGLRLRFRLDWHHEAVRTILRLSGWTFGLVVANQIALLVVLALFNKIPGGVSAYTYSYTFFQLPYGVVAISVMSAVTPGSRRALGAARPGGIPQTVGGRVARHPRRRAAGCGR